MKIAVACGGTGGHVLPGLATAGVMASRGHAVTLWLGGRDVESTAVESWKGRIVCVPSAGFSAGVSVDTLRTLWQLAGAYARSLREMRRERPEVLLAMGSYASVGPVLAARRHRIPVVLHEANAVPGRAISVLSRFAAAVGLTFESARPYFRGGVPVRVTGLPVRADLPAREGLEGLDAERFTILVMGGSQGAHALNTLLPEALAALRRTGADFQAIHLSGVRDADAVRAAYESAGVRHRVFAFLNAVGKAYCSADLAICRAGAGACSELAVCGVPALLVPLPSARRCHQEANARELEQLGAADVVLQKDLDAPRLTRYIGDAMSGREKLDRMKSAMKRFAAGCAADRLADLVESAAHEEGGVKPCPSTNSTVPTAT